MRQGRFDERKIVSILIEGNSVMLKEICHKYGISNATYYKWKSKYNGLEANDIRSLKELENENHRLNEMYSKARLEKKILTEAVSGML